MTPRPDSRLCFWLAAVLAIAALLSLQGCGSGGSASGPPPPPPPLTIITTSLPGAVTGQAYLQSLGATGGTPPYTWSLASGSAPLPAGLTLSSSGVISGTPTAPGTVSATFQVQDSTAQKASATLSLSVTLALTITTNPSAVPTPIIGRAYNFTFQASGGSPPYTWSVAPNSPSPLPPGLTLSTAGVLSGTPTGPSNAVNVQFQVRDSSSATASLYVLMFTVAPMSVATTALSDGNVGISYFGQLFANGGAGAFRWSLASGSAPLPPGVTMDIFGNLSGTPTAPGSFSFTVVVTDAGVPPQTATGTVSLTIQNLLVITQITLPLGVQGQPYHGSLHAAGGTPPYIWKITGGGLEPGLSLSSDGVVSGTPTAPGNAVAFFQVSDSASPPQVTGTSFEVDVNPPLAFAATTLDDAIQGLFYTGTLRVIGGLPPYSAQVVSGALPNGMTLPPGSFFSPLGFSGSPTTTGSFTFGLQVSESSSPAVTVTQSFTLRVNTQLLFTPPPSLPNGLEGLAYTLALTASGGVTPYQWSAPELPSGLRINAASGQINGTPAAAFQGAVLLSVSDSSKPSQTVSRFAHLTVIGKLRIQTSALPPIAANVPFQATPGISGGTPGFSWSLTAGALPAGLSFFPGSAEISGTPTTSGTSNFTLRVVDSGTGNFAQSATQSLALTVKAAAALGRNDSPATATPLSNGTYRASISPMVTAPTATTANPDNDYYKLTANPSALVSVETFAQRLTPSSPLDSVIEIVDANGIRFNLCSPFLSLNVVLNQPCLNDDFNLTTDSRLFLQVPASASGPMTFYVHVLDFRGDARPDFIYDIAISGVN